MPIVSGKLARTGKVLLCINHKLMCLLLIVLGKSALRWLTISLQHHAVIYLVHYVRFILWTFFILLIVKMLIAGCRVRWSKYNCWNIMNSEENSNDNESLWCVSILLSPSFNNNAQFNKTEELPREKSLPLRLQQPPQGPCLHIKPQLCLRLEKKYLKHYARDTYI